MRFRTGTGIGPELEPLEPEYIEPVPVPGLKIFFIRVSGNPGSGPSGHDKSGLKIGTNVRIRNHF